MKLRIPKPTTTLDRIMLSVISLCLVAACVGFVHDPTTKVITVRADHAWGAENVGKACLTASASCVKASTTVKLVPTSPDHRGAAFIVRSA